jgi:hypothetical protein
MLGTTKGKRKLSLHTKREQFLLGPNAIEQAVAATRETYSKIHLPLACKTVTADSAGFWDSHMRLRITRLQVTAQRAVLRFAGSPPMTLIQFSPCMPS